MKKVITLLLCYLLSINTTTYTMLMPWKACEASEDLRKNQAEFKQRQLATTKPSEPSDIHKTLPIQRSTTTKPQLSHLPTDNTSALANKPNNSKKLTQPTKPHNNHLHQQNDAIIQFRDPREKDLTLLADPSLTVQLANCCHAIIQNPLSAIKTINVSDTKKTIADTFTCLWLTSILTAGSTATMHAMPFLTCVLLEYCPPLAPARSFSLQATPFTAILSFLLIQKAMAKKYADQKTDHSI